MTARLTSMNAAVTGSLRASGRFARRDVPQLDADTWLYAFGDTKTTLVVCAAISRCGHAAQAIAARLDAAPVHSGPLFWRMCKGGYVEARVL